MQYIVLHLVTTIRVTGDFAKRGNGTSEVCNTFVDTFRVKLLTLIDGMEEIHLCWW